MLTEINLDWGLSLKLELEHLWGSEVRAVAPQSPSCAHLHRLMIQDLLRPSATGNYSPSLTMKRNGAAQQQHLGKKTLKNPLCNFLS